MTLLLQKQVFVKTTTKYFPKQQQEKEKNNYLDCYSIKYNEYFYTTS